MSKSTPKIAFILPSYRHFDYARQTLLTFHECTPGGIAIVVDDASPDWTDEWMKDIKGQTVVKRFKTNGGLTRSWNEGLLIAKDTKAEILVCGNNDILFVSRWWEGIYNVIFGGYSLVGPVSNAPGMTAPKVQDVRTYVSNYQLTDDLEYINMLSEKLADGYANSAVASGINGFFMAAHRDIWFDQPFKGDMVFCPKVVKMPSGRKNSFPLMTGSEDELQHRWRKRGLKTAVAIGSFVFHYRSVARGKRFARGRWMRMKSQAQPA